MTKQLALGTAKCSVWPYAYLINACGITLKPLHNADVSTYVTDCLGCETVLQHDRSMQWNVLEGVFILIDSQHLGLCEVVFACQQMALVILLC